MNDRLIHVLEEALAALDARHAPIAPRESVDALSRALDGLDPGRPVSLVDAVALVGRGLVTSARTSDAMYFGFPHASPLPASVVADLVASAANPELATFEHAPYAVMAEERAASLVAARLGIGGHVGQFTSGGAESNLSAVLVALASAHPDWRQHGLRALKKDPVVYASREAHPTVTRAARLAGLGEASVRPVHVDDAGRMVPDALADAIGKDRAAGRAPTLVVATAGTTATGAFDALPALSALAAAAGARLHVDAAWGGMLGFGSRPPTALTGIHAADTVAFDPHKGLFAPLGTGLFFARTRQDLAAAFSQRAPYLPRDDERDPRSHGLAWSRRFVGLRVLLALATEGWHGIETRIDQMLALGDRLAERLSAEGIRLRGRSPLPVVTFTGPSDDQDSARWCTAAAQHVEKTLGARVFVGREPSGRRFLRAAIVSHNTTADDVDALAAALGAFSRGPGT